MSRNSRTGRGLHRWRAPLIVVLVVPAILFAFAVKSARASFYKMQPILCDGVDDDSPASILCALPDETTKKLSSSRPTLHALAKVFWALPSRLRITAVESHRPTSFADPTNRFERLLVYRAASADDPDAPH
jgi:hypothetical protein